jgi:hypothetical protein
VAARQRAVRADFFESEIDPVRPEPVEGQALGCRRRGFDKLSPNGSYFSANEELE